MEKKKFEYAGRSLTLGHLTKAELEGVIKVTGEDPIQLNHPDDEKLAAWLKRPTVDVYASAFEARFKKGGTSVDFEDNLVFGCWVCGDKEFLTDSGVRGMADVIAEVWPLAGVKVENEGDFVYLAITETQELEEEPDAIILHRYKVRRPTREDMKKAEKDASKKMFSVNKHLLNLVWADDLDKLNHLKHPPQAQIYAAVLVKVTKLLETAKISLKKK